MEVYDVVLMVMLALAGFVMGRRFERDRSLAAVKVTPSIIVARKMLEMSPSMIDLTGYGPNGATTPTTPIPESKMSELRAARDGRRSDTSTRR